MAIAKVFFSIFKKFDEAVKALRERAIVSPETARQLSDYEKRKSFWVASVSKATETQQILDSLGDAIDRGDGFDGWKKNALAGGADALRTLTRVHQETVFRNAAQTAYSAGRDQQMSQPAVMAARPYRLIQTISDDRRSAICTKLDGTLMPANDPHWGRMQPPYHHRCRSNIRTLSAKQAEARGGVTGWPAQQPAPGFGGAGAAGDTVALSQSLSNLDPVLADVARRKGGENQ